MTARPRSSGPGHIHHAVGAVLLEAQFFNLIAFCAHDANTNTTTQDTTTKPKTSGLDHPSPFQHTARKAPPPTTPAPAAPGHRYVEHLRPASLLGRVSAYTCGVDPTMSELRTSRRPRKSKKRKTSTNQKLSWVDVMDTFQHGDFNH